MIYFIINGTTWNISNLTSCSADWIKDNIVAGVFSYSYTESYNWHFLFDYFDNFIGRVIMQTSVDLFQENAPDMSILFSQESGVLLRDRPALFDFIAFS